MDKTDHSPDVPIRRITLDQLEATVTREVLSREWLLTNGLGGYASGTISGNVTRRYHGLLIAALPAPLGRVVMLNHLAEYLRLPDGRRVQIGGEEPSRILEGGTPAPHYVREFRLDHGVPHWRYRVEEIELEKRILLVHGQNTVHASPTPCSPDPIPFGSNCGPRCIFARMKWMWAKPSRAIISSASAVPPVHEVSAGEHASRPYPPLRIRIDGEAGAFTHEGGATRELAYQMEAERGYHSLGLLWSPGFFHANVRSKRGVTLLASTENWPTILALSPTQAFASDRERRQRLLSLAAPKARAGAGAELVLAADQFIMTPAGRVEDAARARAAGDEVRSVIAGYHWFTDWGRDTMISLEGLTLTTGRHTEAGWILRTFADYIRDGLIPNYFPDGKNVGVYHTADATLWFFHCDFPLSQRQGRPRDPADARPKAPGHCPAPPPGDVFRHRGRSR